MYLCTSTVADTRILRRGVTTLFSICDLPRQRRIGGLADLEIEILAWNSQFDLF